MLKSPNRYTDEQVGTLTDCSWWSDGGGEQRRPKKVSSLFIKGHRRIPPSRVSFGW